MFERVATAHTCVHPTSDTGTSLGRQLTILYHLHMAAFVLFFLIKYMRPAELSGIEKEGSCPSDLPLLPCWPVVIAASETGMSTKTGISDGSVLMDQRWIQWDNNLLHAVKAGDPEKRIWNFIYPAAAKMFKTAAETLGASIDLARGFRTLQEAQRRGQWRAFSSVTRYDKSSRLAANHHSLPRPLRDKLETLEQRAEVLLTKRLQVQRLTSASLVSVCLTCSVASLQKPRISWVCVAMCSTRSLNPGMT